MTTRSLLLQAHAAGALLLGLGLLHGSWAWRRVRRLEQLMQATDAPAQAHQHERLATLARLHQVYLLLAVPGSLLLLASGAVLIHAGAGWAWALHQPWLLAMLGVTLLEFSEGITITRSHLSSAMLGRRAGRDWAPHLDLPLFVAVLVLGLWRPEGWVPVLLVLAGALIIAAASFSAACRASVKVKPASR